MTGYRYVACARSESQEYLLYSPDISLHSLTACNRMRQLVHHSKVPRYSKGET